MRHPFWLLVALWALAGCASGAKVRSVAESPQVPTCFEVLEQGTGQDLRAAIVKGADVNAFDLEGNSVLMGACSMQRYDLVPILIEEGADVDARSLVEGRTALVWAVMYYEDPDQLLVLLDAGADPKTLDKAGKSVLDYARGNWRFAGTEALRRLEAAGR